MRPAGLGNIVRIRIEDAFSDGDFAELAFTYAPVGLVVTENRVIRDCNLTFARMFGYERDALREQTFSLLYPSEAEFVNIRDRGVEQLKQGNSYWDERIMAKKDGTLFWCRVRGHSFTPDEPLQRAVWSFADLSISRPYHALTRREREIVSLLSEGLTSKEIAQKIELSHRTVEVYRARMLKKFGVANTSALLQALGDAEAAHIVERR
ncbi:PAS domain S-box protein [Martelella alba]|uniref:PAS domain S-box protein n=1 Tax=Martelella alba TaxID=2590451 RepID=A0A506U429_9HYPH|nr:PAS domain S-box protein [Martelella alba]